MIPTAIVKSNPVMIREETQISGMLRVRTYTMNISPTPEEPIKYYKNNEPFTFVLTGENSNTECLTPGTPIHITVMERSKDGALRGFGINLEQFGCCDNCEAEGNIQITPEDPGAMLCSQCVNKQQATTFVENIRKTHLE